MLSKSRGHVLRLAAVLHVLFSIFETDSDCTNEEELNDDEDVISEAAVKAAIDFTQLSCQQTASIADRGILEEEIQKFASSMYIVFFVLCTFKKCSIMSTLPCR